MENKLIWIRRTVYTALNILSLVFLTFYGGNVPYMMFSLLILNIAASIIYIVYIFYSLNINQYIPQHKVDKGKNIIMKLDLNNSGRLCACSVKLRFMSGLSEIYGTESISDIGLEPHEETQNELHILCKYSGTYFVGLDKIEITDYFGIFRIKFDMPQKLKVVVRPRIIDINNLAFLNENEEIVNSSPFRQDESVVDNVVREYVSGDNKNMIHWRNSFKTGKLMVRTKSAEETNQYLIIIDGTVEAEEFTERIIKADRLRESAIAIIKYLFKCGYNVNYIIDDMKTGVIYDDIEFNRVVEIISEYNFLKNINVENIIKKSDMEWDMQTSIIVISSNEKNMGFKPAHNIFWVNSQEFMKMQEGELCE